MKSVRHFFLWIWVFIYTVFSLVSCSFTVSSDGAKSFQIDGEQAAKAILVLSQK